MKRKPPAGKKTFSAAEKKTRADVAALPTPIKDAVPIVEELERGLTDFPE